MSSSDNKRIAKNTGLLYFRLLFLTLVSLYTVRVTLEALGVVDYGVYNVIGSVVASLSVLTGAMSSASQRFLSFHLGKKDYSAYSKTFSLLLLGFITFTVLLFIIGEVLGFFFIDGWLNIPQERIFAAKWVYQTSLFAFCIGLLTVPYSSSIIANENMGAFALFSIIEGLIRLGIVFCLLRYDADRLILYGILTFIASLIVFAMNVLYCHCVFKYCRYIWEWNKSLFKELTSYTGWNLFGSVSAMLMNQGQSILLNIYFGPSVNAAKGIADRIYGVIHSFSTNLYMAITPQIIKSYAIGNYQRTLNLVLKSSRITFMLLFVLSFPLICEMNGILYIWLGEDSKTPYMAEFSILMLIYCMVISLEIPITRYIQATGVIYKYQIYVGALTLSYIPIAMLSLYYGASPSVSIIILIVVMGIAQCIRVVIAHKQVNINYRLYFNEVIIPIIKIVIGSVVLYIVLKRFHQSSDWIRIISNLIFDLLMACSLTWFMGFNKEDRMLIIEYIKSKFHL